MRILAMTNLYPNPYQPHRATYNRHRFRSSANEIGPGNRPDRMDGRTPARRGGSARLPPGRQVMHDGLTSITPAIFPHQNRPEMVRAFLSCFRQGFLPAQIREFRPDFVYTPWAYPDGWAVVRLGRKAGLPVILQVLGSDILLLGQNPVRCSARRRQSELRIESSPSAKTLQVI